MLPYIGSTYLMAVFARQYRFLVFGFCGILRVTSQPVTLPDTDNSASFVRVCLIRLPFIHSFLAYLLGTGSQTSIARAP